MNTRMDQPVTLIRRPVLKIVDLVLGHLSGQALNADGVDNTPRWEDLEHRADRCPKCLHRWVSHGVPTEDAYGCSMPTSSMDERERVLAA